MNCPRCGKQIEERALYCTGCGQNLAGLVEVPKNKTPGFSIVSLICGIASLMLTVMILFTMVFSSAPDGTMSFGNLGLIFVAIHAAAAIAAVVFGLLGLLRSIKKPGRKNIKGIAMSSVGMYLALMAALFVIMLVSTVLSSNAFNGLAV